MVAAVCGVRPCRSARRGPRQSPSRRPNHPRPLCVPQRALALDLHVHLTLCIAPCYRTRSRTGAPNHVVAQVLEATAPDAPVASAGRGLQLVLIAATRGERRHESLPRLCRSGRQENQTHANRRGRHYRAARRATNQPGRSSSASLQRRISGPEPAYGEPISP